MDFQQDLLSVVQFEEPVLEDRLGAIHERAVARSKRYLVAEASLLESIMEADRHRVFERFHCTHLAPYCVKFLGLSEEVAACFVRVARKSREIPEIKEAIKEGRITVTKAKAIAAVVTTANNTEWIDKAATLSKAALEREIAAAAPQTPKPEKARPVGSSRVRVEFELSEAEMAEFRRAQDLLAQKLGRTVTLAEVQKELLRVYLHRHDPVQKADRSRERSGKVEDHKVSAAVKHAVNRRDRGCCQARLPDGTICGSSKWVHIHHIVPRSEGGTNDTKNLVTLCSAHHRQWHANATR